jgi:hypothetical protein
LTRNKKTELSYGGRIGDRDGEGKVSGEKERGRGRAGEKTHPIVDELDSIDPQTTSIVSIGGEIVHTTIPGLHVACPLDGEVI